MNIQSCTALHACIPTVYPITMKEGMEWEHPKLYRPPCLHSHCLSHHNEGRNGVGISKTVPSPMPSSHCPSQYTMGSKRKNGNIYTSTLCNYDAQQNKPAHTVVSVLHKCCVDHKNKERNHEVVLAHFCVILE